MASHRVKVCLFFTLLSVFHFSSLVSALEIPPPPEGYVTDNAGMLSAPARQQIENGLFEFEQETSNQIVGVTFPSLEQESLEDFSIRLAEKWKAGQKLRDNGVIFLIFKEDRKMRIEVGYGLEGALPDALAGWIISQVVAPSFKQGNYDQGILNGVKAIMEATKGEYRAMPQDPSSFPEFEKFLKIVLLIFLGLFVIDWIRYGSYLWSQKTNPPRYQFFEWWFLFSLVLFVLQLIFRIVFELLLSSRGGYYGSSRGFGGSSGSSSGGGFSGGGGSFGGGGASGSW